MPKTIAIITNEFCDEILGSRYYLAKLMEVWQQQGIQVQVTAGPHYIPADIAFVHVDTTVVDTEYLDLASRYPVAINGGVKDISKSVISKNLLKRGDSYAGKVIVKTDANYGGVIEHGISLYAGKSISESRDLERPWRKRETLDSYNYPIFNSIQYVPNGVWKNKKLIVEKFLPERTENGDYLHRCYLFFGEQESSTWFAAPVPVVKGSTSTSRGVSDQVPEVLREARNAAGFDYGRFDYTQVDGEVHLFDMNKTPALGDMSQTLVSDQMTRRFADEIARFLS